MNRDFYIRKIAQLSDDKLKELLQLRADENLEIMTLAETEATKRGIDLTTINPDQNRLKSIGSKRSEKGDVNWMSYLAEFLSGLH